MKKVSLLEALPFIAAKSQKRFAVNFQSALLHASEIEINFNYYFINYFLGEEGSRETFIDWILTGDIKDVLNCVSRYGKCCQVFQISADGTVNVLFNE